MAGPLKAIMDKARSVPGIAGTGMMEKLYFSRRPDTQTVPYYAVMTDDGDNPVIDDTVFEAGWDGNGQLLWKNVTFTGTFNSLVSAELWTGYMDAAFFFDHAGIAADRLTATPESTQRGRVVCTEETVHDPDGRIVFRVVYPLAVGFNYLPPTAATNDPGLTSGGTAMTSGLSVVVTN